MANDAPYMGSAKTRGLLIGLAVAVAAAGAVLAMTLPRGLAFAGFTLADDAYLLMAVGGVLFIAASLLAPMSPGKIPYVPVAMGFLMIALALGHMSHKFTGDTAELLQLGMGVAIGLEFGLFLAWGMQQRAEKS